MMKRLDLLPEHPSSTDLRSVSQTGRFNMQQPDKQSMSESGLLLTDSVMDTGKRTVVHV